MIRLGIERMRMRVALLALAAIGFFADTDRVSADIIYQTSFESPTFTAGQSIVGQGSWFNPRGSSSTEPNQAIIMNTGASSGQQALRIDGARLQDIGGLVSAAAAPKSSVAPVLLTSTPHLYWQVDVRLDGPLQSPPIDGDLFSANLAVVSNKSLNDPTGMFISSDGNAYVYGPGGGYLFGTKVQLGTYATLGIDIDATTRMWTYYVNGSVIGSLGFVTDPTIDPSFFLAVAAFGVPAGAGPPSYSPAFYSASFDNYTISTAVPEPSSLVLLALRESSAWGSRELAEERSLDPSDRGS